MVMPIVPEPAPAQLAGAGFSISNQKVTLAVYLASRQLKGKAEITVIPEVEDLRSIQLNCKQCKILKITVNGKQPSAWTYQNLYEEIRLHGKVGVNQYHLLEQKCNDAEDLVIHFPKSVKLEPIDPSSAEAQSIILSKSVNITKKDGGENPMIDLSQPTKISIDQILRFKPLHVEIEWYIDDIREGLNFVGWEDGNLQYPHAYTTGASQSLFPCVDTLGARCTWDIHIECASTLGDAGKSKLQDRFKEPGWEYEIRLAKVPSHGIDLMSRLSSDDQDLDISVVSSGEYAFDEKETQDTFGQTLKTRSFQLHQAVAARHVGFAIGPFEPVNLGEFRELDEEEKLGQNAVPVYGYCLPGRVELLKNTCLPLAKAIDFFTLTYGSYPFQNYKVCFVDDQVQDCVDWACLTLCSNRLLYPGEVIEPLYNVTRQLVHALASQWIGVDINPNQPGDIWAVVGIAYFITDQFMKKLAGNNEYRYRQKRAADQTVQTDIARPSLFEMGSLTHIDPSQIEFMALKAPLVLFILDRRLAKASGSTGLSRIVSRVFLNAKVGDLPNSAINTPYFVKTCEKLGHAKLDTFFAQWVFGAGCPKFRVSQRFNKKKLVVEMTIHQTQADTSMDRDLEKKTFMRDVKEDEENVFAGAIQPAFTGPMTIRIHEADGTPYEHIVEIKDVATKIEIPYNTKYKRLKRSRRQKERTTVAAGLDFAADAQDDVLLYSLGDVLQSEEEMRAWKLVDWSKEDEEKMSQESYEWIRMDADFEWISKIVINMPGYMYLSQLQQDRDVVAQLESVQYLSYQNANPLVSTILVRTLVDSRYFHGIRTAAAAALTKNARPETSWVGFHHLEKAFEEFFCLSGSKMVRSNDFTNRASYYVQCAIPKAIGQIRDSAGKSPFAARNFLYEKLRYNDNSSNEFSDSHYLTTLMSSLAEAIATNPLQDPDHMELGSDDSSDDVQFHEACLEEIDRYRRLDQWIPSYQNILSTTALHCKARLMRADVIPTSAVDFLHYTRDGCFGNLRLDAFSNLIDLGLAKKIPVLKWFLFALSNDPSPYIRSSLLILFGQMLGSIAIGEEVSPARQPQVQAGGLIVEQESSTDARKANLARKQTVQGASEALRQEFGQHPAFKAALWQAIESPLLSFDELGELLHICSMLYDPVNSQIVVLKYPRYVRLINHGKRLVPARDATASRKEVLSHMITFKDVEKIRLRLLPPKWTPAVKATPNLKRQASSSLTGTPEKMARTVLKPPKKPKDARASISRASPSSQEGIKAESGEKTPRPKLKLKLKLGPK